MRFVVYKIVTLPSLLLAALLLSACGDNTATPPAQPAPVVVIAPVTKKNTPLEIEYTGQAVGSREVEVRARVSGILLKRSYTEGSTVQQGDILFEIDPDTYQAIRDQAKGSLAQAQASYRQASLDNKRIQELYAQQVVSAKERDDALASSSVTSAGVAVAVAHLKEAELNLDWTKVTAPISGVTSMEVRSEGSLISTATADGGLLTTIVQLDPIYVHFSISGSEVQSYLRLMDEGKLHLPEGNMYAVELTLSDGSIYPHQGLLTFLDTVEDTRTASIRAKAEFPNPDQRLRPGQFVKARLVGAELQDSILVPQRAVLNTQQGDVILVVNAQNKVEARMVTLGALYGDQYMVLDGLKEGERMIIEGALRVKADATVQPKTQEELQAEQAQAAEPASSAAQSK